MEREEVKDAVSRQEFSSLLAADQLHVERAAGNVFQGFHEGEIVFAPTYK
jgi:phosphatidylinositol-bisphosphatase